MLIPRNAPYHLGFRSITFPLAAGNTAIFKGPEAAPRCAWAIADIFREAGLPAGCLNLITHKASEGAAITEQLVAHPSVKKINFTGSTRVGRIIAASAGRHLKPVLMELGGKNSAVVMGDADIENAATQCALGAFMNVSLNSRVSLTRRGS
jgi:acyl-CoA reductase-like NAD-dependent aldehyde dehydrogenase